MLKIFNKKDICLWCTSVLIVSASFLLAGNFQPLLLITSLLGVSSLIYLAKGHYIGNVIIVVFSLLYGYISFVSAYYGEMITYIGMTLPMAVLAIISWVKNPYQGEKSEVEVASLKCSDIVFLLIITAVVTFVFYFILSALGTNNLAISTLSIATSFFAASLTYKRSEFYALAYALNDIVLVVLWGLEMLKDPSYATMVMCFIMFFINDVYGYISWKKMKSRQMKN